MSTVNPAEVPVSEPAPPDLPPLAAGLSAAREGGSTVPRVLIVSAGVYPPDFGGGQLRVHKTLLRMRRRYPMDVEVLALSGASPQPEWSQTDGIPVHRLPATLGPFAMTVAIGRHLLRARRRGTDVVYTMTIGRVVYTTALLARLLGFPLIVEIMNRNLHEKLLRRVVARQLTRAAELVVAISEPVAREIRALGVAEHRLWVRPNPVDLQRHDLPSAALHRKERRKLGYTDDLVVHLIAGSISPRKNQLLAVAALERLGARHRLLIVGPVLTQNSGYAAQLEQRITASPAAGRIRLAASFTDELHHIMHAVDCLWLTSKEEGLGNVMLEALCCGVPCVINRDLGMDEHVTNGVNGWQALADPVSWAASVEAIMSLIEDSDRRRSISILARGRYDSARFDAEFYNRVMRVTTRAP